MGTAIVLIILLLIVVIAVKSSAKHIKGQGGCCGGGGGTIAEETVKLEKPVVATKVIHISGMHCDNCKNHVTRQLQKIEGVSCKVNLKKNIAVVEMDHEVSDEELKVTVQRAGYEVTSMEMEQ